VVERQGRDDRRVLRRHDREHGRRPCDAVEHTERGYDTSPDYDEFWLERDYRKDARRFRASTLVVHGWQDYNAVLTQGRTSTAPQGFREEASWPPAGVATQRLRLGREATGGVLAPSVSRADAAFVDTGATTEETAMRALGAEASWLGYRSAPLAADLRIAGTPRLDVTVAASADHGHLTPTLVEIRPDGSTKAISRGFLNLRYRDGLSRERPLPPGQPVRAGPRLAAGPHGAGRQPHRADRRGLQHRVGGARPAGRHALHRPPRRQRGLAAAAAGEPVGRGQFRLGSGGIVESSA
jgi:predicted acyl esterase